MKLIKEHENTIDKKGALEREYANEIGSLSQALEEEEETRDFLRRNSNLLRS